MYSQNFSEMSFGQKKKENVTCVTMILDPSIIIFLKVHFLMLYNKKNIYLVIILDIQNFQKMIGLLSLCNVPVLKNLSLFISKLRKIFINPVILCLIAC